MEISEGKTNNITHIHMCVRERAKIDYNNVLSLTYSKDYFSPKAVM